MVSGTAPGPNPSAFFLSQADPVAELLSRRGADRFRFVLLFCVVLLFIAVYVLLADFPGYALFLIMGLFLFFIQGANLYTRMMEFRPPAVSLVDLLVQLGWTMVKLLALASAVWAAYEWLVKSNPAGEAFLFFWETLVRLPLLLVVARPNLFQLVALLAWWPHLRAALATARGAHRFERQLSVGTEQRIARNIESARKLLARDKKGNAHALLDEASRLLHSLAGKTHNRLLLLHRRRVGDQILALRGDGPLPGAGPLPADAQIPADGPSSAQPVDGDRSAQYAGYVESLLEKAQVGWKDVAGLEEVVGELKTAFAMAMAQAPKGVKIEAPRRFLLYGPPGTGKTLLTAAVSNSFDLPFYNVKVSDVLSKFFGESTRLLSALFDLAGKGGMAVLFFDEIEALCGDRDSGRMEGEERRMIAALLAQLDGLKAKGRKSPIFTIAATNVPWQLDPAILSRFEKQFFIPLPDEEARRGILDLHLSKRGYVCQAPLGETVKASRGYSGRELGRLCQEAVRIMMTEANPRMGELAKQGPEKMKNFKLRVKPITAAHLSAAFKKVRPQTDASLMEKFRDWTAAH